MTRMTSKALLIATFMPVALASCSEEPAQERPHYPPMREVRAPDGTREDAERWGREARQASEEHKAAIAEIDAAVNRREYERTVRATADLDAGMKKAGLDLAAALAAAGIGLAAALAVVLIHLCRRIAKGMPGRIEARRLRRRNRISF